LRASPAQACELLISFHPGSVSKYLMQALFGLVNCRGFCLHWVGVAHVEENANVWEMKLSLLTLFLLFLPAYGPSP
jgi:hypothetical protein